MARFARWCFLHRRAVLAIWLIALIGFLAVGRLTGSAYTDSESVPGTDSNQAQTVLQSNFSTQSGDVDQIVFHAKQGTLRSPATETAVTNMLARVSQLAHVRSVTSPYQSAGQISSDGTIGFATVTFDALAANVATSAVTSLTSTAQSVDDPRVDVQLGGAAIESNEQSGTSSNFLLGVVLAAGGPVLCLSTVDPGSGAPAHRCARGDRDRQLDNQCAQPQHGGPLLRARGRHLGGPRRRGRLLAVRRQPPPQRSPRRPNTRRGGRHGAQHFRPGGFARRHDGVCRNPWTLRFAGELRKRRRRLGRAPPSPSPWRQR